MKTLRILVDMDGTIVDMLTPFCAWLKETHNVDLTPADIDDWDLIRCVPPEVGYKVYDFFKQSVYRDLKPYPGAIETLKEWKEAGHEIVLVTWTSPKYAEGGQHFGDKCAWVLENLPFISPNDFTLCDARWRIEADVFIDDKPAATRAYRDAHPDAVIWSVGLPYAIGDHLNMCPAPDVAWKAFAEAIPAIANKKEGQNLCMTPLPDGSMCRTINCAEHTEKSTMPGAYYPKNVWRMLGRMEAEKSLDSVDAEIAYARELAQIIKESGGMPPHLRLKLLQDNIKMTVDLVEKREKLLVARQFLLPHQTLRVILMRIKQILQRHVTDELLLDRLGKEIAQIDVSNSKAALQLVGGN